MRIAVAGGTGLVGQHVVDAVTEDGHQPVVLARSTGVDIVSGRGLIDALAGVEIVIDVTNVASIKRDVSVGFFEAGSRNLLAAEAQAGVRHHVVLSIVGIDDSTFGYYQGKLRQEALVERGPLPWSILRATQFHEFAGQVLARSSGPVAIVPSMRMQPVAAREVAAELVRIAEKEPVGRSSDLAGPQEEQLSDLARKVLRHQGSHRLVIPARLPGAAGRAMRDGTLIPRGPATYGQQTFAQWLEGQPTW
jgi:uncharacterized protein YbjT (DUF2867 family)